MIFDKSITVMIRSRAETNNIPIDKLYECEIQNTILKEVLYIQYQLELYNISKN